jgi:membrane-bound metal-dependent hydrolase YbcI (DUF457 family)
MPSPVGHAIAGLTVHALASRGRTDLRDLRLAAVLAAAACAPDLDLALRFVGGRIRHQAESHSIGVALLAGLAALLLARLLRWERPLRLGVAVSAAWASHVALDFLGRDTNPPIGVMALWPFSSSYFKSPWPIFLDIGRTLEWSTVWWNALAAAWEVVLLLPLLLAAGLRSFRRS